MKICFLPLDSRPCTSLFPRQLAALRGVELITPPVELMDYFKNPSKYDGIWDWVERETIDAEAFILSMEQLLFGGLIASRSNTYPLESLKQSLKRLEGLKECRPWLKIYASNVLMRTTVSALSQESQRWWEQIARYSRTKYAILSEAGENKKQAAEQLEQLETEIPKAVLEEFLEARQRNHIVNMECVKLAKECVFERLFILQEDCSSVGVQVLEQREILKAIKDANLQNKVFLHNGTDEAGMELTLYALGVDFESEIQIEWLWENRDFTAKYEDRPFTENIKSHMQSVGMGDVRESQHCLLILPPRTIQGDYCPKWENPDTYSKEEYEGMVRRVAALIGQEKCCYLLDLAYANGGDLTFMKQLAQMVDLRRLYGYAAWNTASNSLGTILAQILASRGNNTEGNWKFTAERLGDDLLYQGAIRQTLAELLISCGEDIWCLKEMKRAESKLQRAVQMHRTDLEAIFGQKAPEFSVHLLWPRVFEAEVMLNQ